MSSVVVYHLGGFKPAAPQQNRAEFWDAATGTYTSWDSSGVQTAQRPLTADETAQLAAQDTAASGDANRSTFQQKLTAALAANQNDVAQDQAIMSQAATITAASITNLATAATAIGKLAQAVSLLAGNDVNTKKELQAIAYMLLNKNDTTAGT